VQFLPGNNETIVIQVRNKLSRIVQVNYPAMPDSDRSIIYLKAVARRNCDGGIIMILQYSVLVKITNNIFLTIL